MHCQTPAIGPFHALTVDVEDWYHICQVEGCLHDLPSGNGRVVMATTRLLELLRGSQSKATFFVLGTMARQYPELIAGIAANGHEIASHGWSHRRVLDLEPEAFADELDRTAELLEQQTGQRPYGFRAPQWSLCRRRTPWAFEILARKGYRYDSSLTPLAFIGDPRGPQRPHRIDTEAGSLWEVPPMVTPSVFGNLPTGGGWGFRFFPERVILQTLLSATYRATPGVLFVHPRELDPDGPRLALGLLRSFLTYGPRSSSEPRLRRLLERFRFKTLGEFVASWQSVS